MTHPDMANATHGLAQGRLSAQAATNTFCLLQSSCLGSMQQSHNCHKKLMRIAVTVNKTYSSSDLTKLNIRSVQKHAMFLISHFTFVFRTHQGSQQRVNIINVHEALYV